MNEIQLSDSLPVIETEIRQYQNLAGESIFEIGRRLKHVKENDLAHGEFGKWLESININHRVANQMVKVASTPELNSRTSSNLGMQALYEIATLPEPERTKEHVTEKGESKTPDEMTVKELRELKKQIKKRDEENELLQSKLEDAENQKSETKTIYKDKVPKYLEEQIKRKDEEAAKAKKEAERLQSELYDMEKKHNDLYRRDYLTEEEQLGSRRFQAENNMLELGENMTAFLEENAINTFKQGAIANSSQRTKDLIAQRVDEMEEFCRAMRTALNNQITIN